MMELRKNSKYSLMAVTSMGIRITPANRQPVDVSHFYEMQATSAESNVLNISASLGLKTKVLTRFVQDSSIARFIKSELRRRNIEYEGVEVPQGNPWGYRHQINIADSGYGGRRPYVLNDRAGEVGRTIQSSDFDLEGIFKDEGCQILHLSGLIAALSPETTQSCLDIAEYAKSQGTLISFDLNHRASFWKGREEELLASFHRLASIPDILIGNEEDYQLALGIKGPEAGGKDVEANIDDFKEMISRVKEKYPNTSIFANTLREVLNANEHMWGGILHAEGKWYVEEPRDIQVLDRIGGGDGFVGGLLYGVLNEWEPEKCLQFAWSTGALTSTLLTDYASPSDEDQIWDIYTGNARVKR